MSHLLCLVLGIAFGACCFMHFRDNGIFQFIVVIGVSIAGACGWIFFCVWFFMDKLGWMK